MTPRSPPAKIAAYARTIAAGGWLPGGMISFFADGRLRDGAHRCLAVVRSGVSIVVTHG